MERFERLLIEQLPRLRRYARALCGDQSQADDLVQECLLRAMTRRKLWLPHRKLRPWLFTIMHNLNVNEVRRTSSHSRSQEAYRDALTLELAGGAGLPEGLELRDLDRGLATLPLEQREVVLLVGVEGLSYKEAATVLDVPMGTVMSRLARGRDRLRELLARDQRSERRQAR